MCDRDHEPDVNLKVFYSNLLHHHIAWPPACWPALTPSSGVVQLPPMTCLKAMEENVLTFILPYSLFIAL